MATEIVEYQPIEAALADLEHRYKGVVFQVTTPEGMSTARKGRAEIRKYQYNLEHTRIKIKAPALQRCRDIDGDAKRIDAGFAALGDPIDAQIKNEEKRKDDERMAVVRAEEARIAAEQQAIKEAEEKRMAAERAEIARRQAELDRAEAERLKAEQHARFKIEEEQRGARLRIEEEERQARLAREEADRKARQVREAEEARLKAERDKLEAAQRAADAQARKEREAEEAKQREIQLAAEAKAKAERDAAEAIEREKRRAAADLMDARTMLLAFKERFGRMKEFAGVTRAIIEYFKEPKS